jgi:unsaturated rhamnogalacturonyl hydrolase
MQLRIKLVFLLVILSSSSAIVFADTPKPKPIDWSVAIVESTMKRFPTPKDLGVWNYPRGLYLYSQYLVYKRTHDPRYLKYIRDFVDYHVDENGFVTNTNPQGAKTEVKLDSLDNMNTGNLLLALYQETKEPRYKLAAAKIRARLNDYPRTKEGGFWHAVYKSREWQLWGDGVFMSLPFLIRYGSIFGDSKYANDEATKQMMVYASHLNDPKTGLMFHAYDESRQATWADKETGHSPEIWCRAMGWFGMTLIEVLELLPKDHPNRPKLIAQLQQLVKAWSSFQDKKTGLWYQIVNRGDDPSNWLETSSSSMYTFTIARAVDRGYVDKSYMKAAQAGYAGVLTRISLGDDGLANLTGICEGTNVADLPYYYGRKQLTNDLHGLGAFLIMNEKFMNKSLKGSTRGFWKGK